MWIKIEPLDVLLFRESKPFSAGENFRAAGRFPPSSLPLVGAIRSRALAHPHLKVDVQTYVDCAREGKTLDAFDKLGTPNSLAPLAAMGPFLSMSESGKPDLCLPWPKDLLREGEEETNGRSNVVFLKPKPEGNPWPVRSFDQHEHAPLYNLAASKSAANMEMPAGGFMKGRDLGKYLIEGASNESPPIGYVRQNDIAVSETRLGITLGDGRTAEKGRIYSAAFTRMQNMTAFFLQLWDTQVIGRERGLLPAEGFLALGGEARAAHFCCLKKDDEKETLPSLLNRDAMDTLAKELIEKLVKNRRFKLYLLTPSIFAQGWLPDGVNANDFSWQATSDVKATLIAAAVGKPDDIGGWNLVNNAPRPLYRAAPAGSVYFFEAAEDFTAETAQKLLEKLHFQSLMQPQANGKSFPGFCREAGFGLAAVGLWDDKQED